MTKGEREHLMATSARLGRMGFGLYAIEKLTTISRQLSRLDERSCNGYQTPSGDWDEKAEKRADGREARLEAIANFTVLEAIKSGQVLAGTRLYRQSDPRGCALYVCGPDVPEPLDSHYSNGVAL